jgi:hypothetical protein
MIRKYRPDVLWATYPIATAHIAGLLLSRLSGVPLIADYRDSMTEPTYPTDPLQWRIYTAIEARVVRHAVRCVFTTPGARRMYEARYPDVAPPRLHVIENAFDEENFRSAELLEPTIGSNRPFTLVHSGVVYPSERDPGPLFRALGRHRRTGQIDASGFRLVLRATGHDDLYAPILADQGIEDLVELAPPLPYAQALRGGLNVSGAVRSVAAQARTVLLPSARRAAEADAASVRADAWSGGPLPTLPGLANRMAGALAAFPGQALIITSGQDMTAAEFRDVTQASKAWRTLLASDRVVMRHLNHANHTFSQQGCKQQVESWTRDWLDAW